MIRDVLAELAALVAVALFCATIALWAVILAAA